VSNIESKMGAWRATLIQRTRHQGSIIASALLDGDFIDSIGHEATLSSGSERSALPLKADMFSTQIDVSSVQEAEEPGSTKFDTGQSISSEF